MHNLGPSRNPAVGQMMSEAYQVKPLLVDQIPQAYPVISILDPGLSPQQWCDYASFLLTHPGGSDGRNILTVQNALAHIFGLSIHWVKPDLRQGRILEIENFAVVDIIGNRAPARILLQALEDIARERACGCVSISLLNPHMRKWLRDKKTPAMDVFRAAGFRGEQLRLRKCFAPVEGLESPDLPILGP